MSAGLAALRRFRLSKPAEDRCELCAAPLASGHPHLLESGLSDVRCSCESCASLFPVSGLRYRRLPTSVRRPEAPVDDAVWEKLDVPIGLAFFRRLAGGGAAAYYPSPAGAMESTLPVDACAELAALEPEVEALLVRRQRGRREDFIVPIDRCFRLIGLVRANWKGFSGGDAVHAAVESFFETLRREAA